VDFSEWRAFVQTLKEDWKELWRTRFNDEDRAEGVATRSFTRLFVDRGEVIIATRDYKPPDFHEILRAYMPEYLVGNVDPTPAQGGWGKFIREYISKQRSKRSSNSKVSNGKVRKEFQRSKTVGVNGFRRARYPRLKKSGKRWKPSPL